FAGDLRDIEFPPMKGAAGELEMKIGVRFAFERNDAIDTSSYRTAELIGFNNTSDVWANGARNHLTVGDTVTVSEVHFFRVEIGPQGICAQMLRPMTKAAVGEQQESIC